jgi:nitrogen fixation NifU-like protein
VSADLYGEAIKALAREAHGAGALAAPDAIVRLDNPYCGDRVDLTLSLGGARVAALAHQTRGCLLCRAAASVVGLRAPGAPLAQIEQAVAVLDAMLAGGEVPPHAWGELQVFRPVRDYPARYSCVSLPMQALRKAVQMALQRRH